MDRVTERRTRGVLCGIFPLDPTVVFFSSRRTCSGGPTERGGAVFMPGSRSVLRGSRGPEDDRSLRRFAADHLLYMMTIKSKINIVE